MKEKTRIGLFGFGAVGQGTFHIIEENPYLSLHIARICVKDPLKKRELPEREFTFRKEDILQDESISIVVEAISNAEEAYVIVKEAMLAGKHVVTANKKMLSEHLPELLDIQRETKTILRYEAAVCAAIPVLDVLDHHFAHEPLLELSGIVNGSTNYILCRMQEEALDFQSALQNAQDLGFAEADPFLDISGQDARNKIVVAAIHAFGEFIEPADVQLSGIDKISANAVKQAQNEGKCIKLVARLYRKNGKLQASVKPELLEPGHPLFSVTNEDNMLLLKGQYGGHQQLSGKGAGSLPTGTAVVADIRAVLDGRSYSYLKYQSRKEPLITSF